MQFSIFDYPDDNFFNVTHKLLDNEPVNKKFKYSNKNKVNVQTSILQYLNDLRQKYNLPPAFASWDSIPPDILKARIEKDLQNDNISSDTFIGFHCIDEPDQHRVKISYSVNNKPRKAVRIRYKKEGGIDNIKHKMSDEMNKIREENGLNKVKYIWNNLEFTCEEINE